MWKRDEAVKPAGAAAPPAAPAPAAATAPAQPAAAAQPKITATAGTRDVVNIGKSVVIKGELNGSEDLTIEGQVEGKIELRDHVLTIGPNGKIKAQVFAKSVIVLGEVDRQRHREREGRHPRQRLGRRRHRLAARGDCRRRALPRQRRHAAKGSAPARHGGEAPSARRRSSRQRAEGRRLPPAQP